MKLLALVCLLFHLCMSKETSQVPDITAIYHVGRNSNGKEIVTQESNEWLIVEDKPYQEKYFIPEENLYLPHHRWYTVSSVSNERKSMATTSSVRVIWHNSSSRCHCHPIIETQEVNYVDIHLRTDALGLPIAVGDDIIDPENLQFFLDFYNLDTWEHENWTVVLNTSFPLKIQKFDTSIFFEELSTFYKFHNGVQISVTHGNCRMFGLLLTSYNISLKYQTEYYYITSGEGGYCNTLYLYRCSSYTHYNNVYRVGGDTMYCSHVNSYDKEYYKPWRISQDSNGVLKLQYYYYGSQAPTWNFGNRINYYTLLSTEEINIEVVPLVHLLETDTEAKLVSPSFTPKHEKLCITALFHTVEPTILNSVDVYAEDMLLNRVFLGSFGKNLNMAGAQWHTERMYTHWPESVATNTVHLVFEVSVEAGRLRLERIASCDSEYEEDVVLLPNEEETVPFSDIRMPVFTPRDNDSSHHFVREEECVVRNHLGTEIVQQQCLCPPGFVGPTCKIGCGRNRYGKDCSGKCSIRPSECSGLLLCTPVAGCFCAPGYRGETCEEKCNYGTYGNNCTRTCGHCEDGTCDIHTGKCSACLPGYQLPLCQEKYDYVLLPPEVTRTGFGEVIVTPLITERTEHANPSYYTVQFKKQCCSESWISVSTYPIAQLGETVPVTIKDLEHGVPYRVRVVLIDADFNSYEGNDIPRTDFISLCTIPENPEYHMEIISNLTAFTASWKYVLENDYWCPVEKFQVSWKGGWEWTHDFTKETSYTVSNLLPGTSIKIKVQAVTKNGFAPYSSLTEFSTKLITVTEPVENLRIESVTSKSARICWKPPLGFKTVPLTYVVKYKCLKQVACQKQCADSSGELHVTNTNVTLEVLYPMSQYVVTVSPDDGPAISIILGTKVSAPVEVAEPSLKPSVKTNTSVTVYWSRPDVCSGFFRNYVYHIYKVGSTQMLQTGSTQSTSATFVNLQVSTDYRVLVYVQTSFESINYDKYLEINVSTSATVPDQVQNLTVYKRGRHLLGVRWALPVNSYGPVMSFTIKYGHSENTSYKTETIKPNPCVVWPHLFCHTVTRLQADRMYNISVSARNSEVDADGIPAVIKGITKEKTPGPPENVKLVNSTSNSFTVQWDYPQMANGIIRSFLINIEETEQYNEENCCQIFPISEITVTQELEHYFSEVSGLHAASTYIVSLSAKTVAFGPSQVITVHTRPPPLAVLQLPDVVIEREENVTWQPQKSNYVKNSDFYKPLIKGSLIVVVSNDTEFNNTGIENKQLNEELKTVIGGSFYIAAECTNEMEIELGTDETVSSKWGEFHNMALQEDITYQVAVVQITEYCGMYNFDVVWSLPIGAHNSVSA